MNCTEDLACCFQCPMENLGFSWPGLAACSPGLLCHRVSVDAMTSIIQRGNLIALQHRWNMWTTPLTWQLIHILLPSTSLKMLCVLLDFWGFFLLCAPGQRELARHSTVLRSFTVPSPASLCLLHHLCSLTCWSGSLFCPWAVSTAAVICWPAELFLTQCLPGEGSHSQRVR